MLEQKDKKDVVANAQRKQLANQEKKGGISNWDLMRLAEEQDCEAFEASDFDFFDQDYKQKYKEFYDDVKHPANYVKEDW